jgi:uncharacterized repeat protein (TIGR03803 family)
MMLLGVVLGSVVISAASVVTLARSRQPAVTGTYTVLYSFPGGADGAEPEAGLVRDAAGNLYGTTRSGDAVVFKVAPDGTETVLHTFTGAPDGFMPQIASLVLDSAGNIYGVTPYGGDQDLGIVFELTPSGEETILHSFDGTDGSEPFGGLVHDSAGNLYGTTAAGGTSNSGTVFRLSPDGTETILHSFEWHTGDGVGPVGNLATDSSGNLYGTTEAGGTYGAGTVFEVAPDGREKVLHSFAGPPNDGLRPLGTGVLRDGSGNLYGVTYNGGSANRVGRGTVFKVTSSGVESLLLSFNARAYGGFPYDGLVRDGKGNLFGMTSLGGANGLGALFELTAEGKEIVLHNFGTGPSWTDGAAPYAGLIHDAQGNLYGTASSGGAYGLGVVFKYTP